MPDAWENQNRLDPAAAGDAAADGDDDGLANGEEYVADTDPADPASRFAAAGAPAGAAFVVRSPMSANRLYSLQASSNLAEGVWTLVPGQGPRRGAGAADSMADTNAAPHRFYRLQVEVP